MKTFGTAAKQMTASDKKPNGLHRGMFSQHIDIINS
jgi:hypothetical protein